MTQGLCRDVYDPSPLSCSPSPAQAGALSASPKTAVKWKHLSRNCASLKA